MDKAQEIDVIACNVKSDAEAMREHFAELIKLHYGWQEKGYPLGAPTDYGPTAEELGNLLAAMSKMVPFIDHFYLPRVDRELARFKEQQAQQKAQIEAQLKAAQNAEAAKK